MIGDEDKQRSEEEAKLEQEIRTSRKFSAADAIARMAGPGAMKGASPVSPVQQAETEIGTWLRDHIADSSGILPELLRRRVRGSELLLASLDEPLNALEGYCRKVLASDLLLKELVREADFEWGRRMGERPYFEREGSPDHPEDPYTAGSVRLVLDEILKQLADTREVGV